MCLPLNNIATFDANLPKVCPSASTNTQFFSTVFLFADIVLKLYAVTYFNLMEWEKAIEYFKKSLNFDQAKYKIYTNQFDGKGEVQVGYMCLFRL